MPHRTHLEAKPLLLPTLTAKNAEDRLKQPHLTVLDEPLIKPLWLPTSNADDEPNRAPNDGNNFL